MNKNLIAGLWLMIATASSAQKSNEPTDHCQIHDDHFHSRELGLSSAPVWFIGGDEPVSLGLHAHFIQRLGDRPFGIGFGAEFILDEHRHQTYSVVGQWTPIPAWHFVIAPGVALEQAHHEEATEIEEWEAGWACHIELMREFSFGKLDIGPSLEYALDAHGSHVALGVHLGIPLENDQ